MIKMKRSKIPTFLKDSKKTWTDSFVNGSTFSWHNKQKELLKLLKNMTASHCAFCDDVLVPKGSDNGEIEHFRPKGKYKKFAFAWANLYPICRSCNGTKNDRFDKLLLRPDENDFCFSDWFRLDPSTFELKPVKIGNPNWERAKITIELYGLNEKKTTRRQFEHDNIIKNNYKTKDNQPFRFMN